MKTRDAFVAIADPIRREILVLLRNRGQLSAGEIAGSFAHNSRPGISRHLRVLRECGVVCCERQGKQWNYTLDPKPLVDLHDGWLSSFTRMNRDSLAALRRRVEGS